MFNHKKILLDRTFVFGKKVLEVKGLNFKKELTFLGFGTRQDL